MIEASFRMFHTPRLVWSSSIHPRPRTTETGVIRLCIRQCGGKHGYTHLCGKARVVVTFSWRQSVWFTYLQNIKKSTLICQIFPYVLAV